MTSTVTTTTATFTVNQPKDTVGQFTNVWKHDYTVTVQPDGTFSGIGSITDNGGDVVVDRDDHRQVLDTTRHSDHVTFNTVPVGGGATFAVTDAPMDSTTVPVASTWAANIIEFQIAQPVFETITVNGVTDVREPRRVRGRDGRRQDRSAVVRRDADQGPTRSSSPTAPPSSPSRFGGAGCLHQFY